MRTIHGPRRPAETILLCTKDGADAVETDDHSSLPIGGIEAVERGARAEGLL